MGSEGSRRHGFWTLAVVALVGLLVQACSDNKGPAGPSFPSGQTGHADTPAQILVRVAINAGTIELNRRAGITVVVTNLNGRPLANRLVQLSTTVGTLDRVDGFTDADGKFVTTLRVTEADATGRTSATVTAFVEGASGQGTINFVSPEQLVISPATVDQNVSTTGTTCTVGGFSTQFTVSGGVPPYTLTLAGTTGGSVTSGGLYTVAPFTIPVGTAGDLVTVTDNRGATNFAKITFTCMKQATTP